MSDTELADLFAEGTAPESDMTFARGVSGRIGRARLRLRLVAISFRVSLALMLAGAAFVAATLIEPLAGRLADGAPQFMGVPVPVVLGAMMAGLILIAARQILSRGRIVSPEGF